MPFHRDRYPADWAEIRQRILARAGNCCEQCGARNHEPHPVTGKRVVLTIAHLEHDTSRNEDADLASLCQPCHLRHDAQHHAANARVTRARKKGPMLPGL